MSRNLRIVFLVLLACAFGEAAYHHAHLPTKIASHFDFNGQSQGMDDLATHTKLQVMVTFMIGGFFLTLGSLCRRYPDYLISLPHRQHWLAPKQREKTFEVISAATSAFGIIVIGYFMLFFQQIYQANVSGSNEIHLLPLLIGQFVLLGTLFAMLYRRFSRLPISPPTTRKKKRAR